MSKTILTELSREEIMNAALDAFNVVNEFDRKTMTLATVQDIHFFTADIREKLQTICKELNCCEVLPANIEKDLDRAQMEKILR